MVDVGKNRRIWGKNKGTEEMPQWLRLLANISEDAGCIPSNPSSRKLFFCHFWALHAGNAHTYPQAKLLDSKRIKMFFFKKKIYQIGFLQ